MIVGSIVALVTPMTNNGDIDDGALENLIDLHIAKGTSAIVIAGSTGEASTLDHDEQGSLISRAVEFAKDRIAIIAGIGANSTKEAVHLAAAAKDAGAMAGLSVVPYYNKPTQEGLFKHFATVANSVDFPQILYNIPGRTAANMSDETILRLAALPNVVGLKDATSDMARIADMVERVPKDFALYSGDDETTLAFMLLGGHGTISVTANIAPGSMSKMASFALQGDLLRAREINKKLISVHKSLTIETNPIPIKFLMAERGLIAEGIRLPLTPLAEEHRARLRYRLAIWEKLGTID